jgi:hypothetical protein
MCHQLHLLRFSTFLMRYSLLLGTWWLCGVSDKEVGFSGSVELRNGSRFPPPRIMVFVVVINFLRILRELSGKPLATGFCFRDAGVVDGDLFKPADRHMIVKGDKSREAGMDRIESMGVFVHESSPSNIKMSGRCAGAAHVRHGVPSAVDCITVLGRTDRQATVPDLRTRSRRRLRR